MADIWRGKCTESSLEIMVNVEILYRRLDTNSWYWEIVSFKYTRKSTSCALAFTSSRNGLMDVLHIFLCSEVVSFPKC